MNKGQEDNYIDLNEYTISQNRFREKIDTNRDNLHIKTNSWSDGE